MSRSIYTYRIEYPDGSIFEGDLAYVARHFNRTRKAVEVAYLSRGKTLEQACLAPDGVVITRWDNTAGKDPRREAKFVSNPILMLNNNRRVNYSFGQYYIYRGAVQEHRVVDPLMIEMIDRLWGVA